MRQVEPPLERPEAGEDNPQMARLDPRASRLKYRLERLMLTPLFRFSLRVILPLGLCFGAGAAWFAVEENRAAFNLMLEDVRVAIEGRPEFQVRMMVVDGAGEELEAAVRADLPLDFPVSSFDIDLDRMQRRVAELDAVKSVDLRIRQGGVLQVDVVERIPAVLWRSEAGLQLMDEAGVVVGPAHSRAAHANLPVIAGDILRAGEAAALAKPAAMRSGAEILLAERGRDRMAQAAGEALRLHELAAPIRQRLRGFERQGARRWDVVLDRDQRIKLPETGAERALEWAIAMALTPSFDLLSRDVVAVDLRLPRRPTVRMTEQATQEMWRIKAIESGREDF